MNESNLLTRPNAKVTAIAIASIVLGAAIQSFAAVPPAGASGFGASSSSGGAGAVVSRTPPASGTSVSSTPASSAPSAGNLYLGVGVGTSTATGGLPSSAVGPQRRSKDKAALSVPSAAISPAKSASAATSVVQPAERVRWWAEQMHNHPRFSHPHFNQPHRRHRPLLPIRARQPQLAVTLVPAFRDKPV